MSSPKSRGSLLCVLCGKLDSNQDLYTALLVALQDRIVAWSHEACTTRALFTAESTGMYGRWALRGFKG